MGTLISYLRNVYSLSFHVLSHSAKVPLSIWPAEDDKDGRSTLGSCGLLWCKEELTPLGDRPCWKSVARENLQSLAGLMAGGVGRMSIDDRREAFAFHLSIFCWLRLNENFRFTNLIRFG